MIFMKQIITEKAEKVRCSVHSRADTALSYSHVLGLAITGTIRGYMYILHYHGWQGARANIANPAP